MRPPRTAVWFAFAGILLAVSFVALGDVSPEPSDHPRRLMAGFRAGSRPVVIPYTILVGFCLPGFWVNYVLRGITLELLGYHGLWGLPGSPWNYLTYPLLQGALYGGVVWALISIGSVARKMILRRNTSPEITAIGSSSGARPSQANRWCLLSIVAIFVTSYSIISLYLLLPVSPPSWSADYDEETYTQIRDAIAADPKHLVGKSFDEVTKALSLEDVPWDDASFQEMPARQHRMYHFRGFAFHVTVDLQLPDNSPVRQTGSYTFEELQRHGVLRLAHQNPIVQIDGLKDRQERMKRFWTAIDEECDRINAEAEVRRRKSPR